MIRNQLKHMYKRAEKHKEENLVKALNEIPPDGVFLDIGCWDGKKTLRWAKAAKAKSVLGIEVIKGPAKIAKSKKIKVFIADIEKGKWPIKSNSVDCVFSNLVIEHLSDVDNFISESYRILKKGGCTIVSTNNLASWHNIASLFLGWAPFDLSNSTPKRWQIGNPLAVHEDEYSQFGKTFCHKCVYTEKWLKEWYQLYHFKHIKTYGSGYYPLPSFIGSLDKTHSAFITLVFKK